MLQRLVLKNCLKSSKTFIFVTGLCFFLYACNADDETDEITIAGGLAWTWLGDDGKVEPAIMRSVYEEKFGEGNSIRLNQSMAIFGDKVFCFNDGTECYIFDIDSKKVFNSGALPEISHHNNAQFLDVYYDKGDKYPLLLLSRGDYPPNQNELYIVRVIEKNDSITFHRVKTIKNTIAEAKNGGSWVADEEHNKLFLYCMTTGDWRTKDNNNFCIFSFILPDTANKDDVTLTYDDVLERWEYTYLIHQGGTYYKGYLFFNVQNMDNSTIFDRHKKVIAINIRNGALEAFLPLYDPKETEGICVYNNKLFVTFKNGNAEQDPNDTVFSLYEYSLPAMFTNN